MVEPTVRDVLAFHRVDRAAYDQLLSLGVPPPPARNAVALLMWLGRRGGGAGVDAVDRARRLVRTRHDAARLASEARAVLHGGAAALDLARRWAGAGETLISSVLGGGGVDVRRFFALVPDDAPRRGVAEVLDGVGALVFDDRLYALLRRHEEGGGAVLPAELAAPYRRPLAPALAPVGDGGCRSLFITFSKGSPLTREEIEEYFTERWGDCLEKVMMERTPAGEPPTYGRIVFRHAATAAAVLGGEHLVKLVINGRQLRARKYFPRKASAFSHGLN
uniref:OSIGBa0140A01.10 protein n=1 Tax=Oryza sativa TaxID=4530 RepID=Q01KS9_ORYSA|nr:OSIGBa0140A01.10 [Oryza sativa]